MISFGKRWGLEVEDFGYFQVGEAMSGEKSRRSIPHFNNETEERAFWEKHGTSEYLDISKAKNVHFPNLKKTTKSISIRHMLDELRKIAYPHLFY